ncbi:MULTISPECIES: aminotransferase class I/II-fold pyridoxal phosphate-dependent enzyme [Prochlorococcus]|uniref:methionine gamma-lyase family protein n=1 Tax=Prochlorococcus TaxID=1218 RepID=UPI000533B3F8|nr:MULTISPECIES: methionine gamma-lyase family protein [Prochlorococcus]KGG13700.1 Aluminum resistance protein [Prochlorococcus sp. MIT 0601]
MASKIVCSVELKFDDICEKRTKDVLINLEKVLNSFSKEGLGAHHFSSLTGYAHNDLGRELIDRVYANIFGCEKAAVRMQFVSGTHAITCALFGVLRPSDSLLSITGKPYDTLEEVIGLRGSGKGSLLEFGIKYDQLNIFDNGEINLPLLDKALDTSIDMIFIQRSCGYSWRPSLSINSIKDICNLIHAKQPDCICFVDNCYGEFVEPLEPTDVGADLIAGSLIKNPGGTIVPSGGYIAGRKDLVEKSCCRLTAPGIGSQGGSGFDLNRIVLQGLFLAPQMVSESLIGAELIAGVFNYLGFEVKPLPGMHRSDLIQGVQIGDSEILKVICRAFQNSSPVGSFLNPIPSSTPGYEMELIMAGGTFIDGSTSEFSADAPLKPPYNLFVQGGTHRSHVKIAIIRALVALHQTGFIDLSQKI